MSDEIAENWQDGIRECVKEFAKANADAKKLEHFRKSKIAILMAQAELENPEKYKSAASQDAYARRHPEYLDLLEGYRQAVETQEYRRWQLKIREMRFEEWRTEQANQRNEIKRYGA
jgi:hypothetical protein